MIDSVPEQPLSPPLSQTCHKGAYYVSVDRGGEGVCPGADVSYFSYGENKKNADKGGRGLKVLQKC